MDAGVTGETTERSVAATSNPATFRQKVVLAAFLVAATIILMILAQKRIAKVEEVFLHETRVDWQAPEAVSAKPGPPSFYYDRSKKQLVYVGLIDERRKAQLISLLPSGSDDSIAVAESYWAAIDKLAYDTNDAARGLVVQLLLLGGLAGALGAQLRSFANFIGHVCYKKDLDLTVWWPYYAIRPVTGFILGTVVVTVIQAGLLSAGDGLPSSTLWWVGIAFLSGFGEDEFTQRLRHITRTVFGEAKT